MLDGVFWQLTCKMASFLMRKEKNNIAISLKKKYNLVVDPSQDTESSKID